MKKLKSLSFKIYSFAREHPIFTLVFIACLGIIYIFFGLLDEVLEGDSRELDTQILLMMRNAENHHDPVGPLWFEDMMRDLTALGGTIILTLITLASATYLFIIRQRHKAWFLLISVGTGILVSNAMKLGFDIPRPDLVPHGSHTSMASFPSGHSLMAAVVYLSIGALLAGSQTRYILRVYILSLAILVALLVGLSRVYLGVHWPSDVLAGWLAGSAWAMMVWLLWIFISNRNSSH